MQHRFFRLWRQAIFAIALLFTLQTAAQPVITYHNKDLEESEKYKKGNEYQKDFLLFMDMLQTTHPAFEKNPPFNVKKELKKGYTRCGKCKNLQEFVFYTQQVAAKIHDEHTTVYHSKAADLMYPFHLYTDDKGFYIDNIQKGMEASTGKLITKINGKEISYICKKFKTFYSTNNEAGFKKYFRNQICNFFPWHELGLCEPDSSLNITFIDGSSISLHPVPRNNNVISFLKKTPSPVELMGQRAGGMDFSYQILDGGICYLLFIKCEDRNTYMQKYLPQVAGNDSLRMRLEKQLKRIPVFTEFLDSMFLDMKTQNVNKLVVDVRYNDGGDSSLCNELLSRLKSSVKLQSSYIRFSRLAADFYQSMGDNLLAKNTADTIPSQILGKENLFDGKVIWIQGENTFSSAGMLITFAVDNNIGIVIGEPASYSPTHYGYIIQWNLPNTNIQGGISHVYFIRPDETRGDEIPLAKTLTTSFEDFVNGIDPCYDWATDPAHF